jgi:hypothetical protein
LTDVSGNNHNGTLYNGPVWTTGKNGNGLRFDGANDYVSIPDASSLNPGNNSWTISLWVNIPNTNLLSGLVFKLQSSGSYPGWGIAVAGDVAGESAGKKVVAVYQENYAGNRRNTITNSDVSNGNWRHVAMVADKTAGVVRTYIDGVLVATSTDYGGSWPTLNTTTPLLLGNDNFGDYLNGTIDDLRIYNRALTQPEIQADMNNPL